MSEQIVKSIQEWQALPALALPTLVSTREQGAVFNVRKVGFLLVNAADCHSAGIPAIGTFQDRCFLGSVVVDIEGQPVLRRLPLTLADWAVNEIALAKQGFRKYPSKVEFGCIDNRTYAQIL